MDVLRISEPSATTGFFGPKFQDYCCPFDVWMNPGTKAMTMLKGGENPGVFSGFTTPVGTNICCEDAVLITGFDPLSCTTLQLGSVSGAVVQRTAPGVWVSLVGTITIPTDPPLVVTSLSGGGGGSTSAAVQQRVSQIDNELTQWSNYLGNNNLYSFCYYDPTCWSYYTNDPNYKAQYDAWVVSEWQKGQQQMQQLQAERANLVNQVQPSSGEGGRSKCSTGGARFANGLDPTCTPP